MLLLAKLGRAITSARDEGVKETLGYAPANETRCQFFSLLRSTQKTWLMAFGHPQSGYS